MTVRVLYGAAKHKAVVLFGIGVSLSTGGGRSVNGGIDLVPTVERQGNQRRAGRVGIGNRSDVKLRYFSCVNSMT